MNEVSADPGRANPPTVADVAKLAGVSPMTVSRVINKQRNVRDETQERVRRAIEVLHFVPNSAARALASGEKLRLGILYAPPPSGIFSDFLIGTLNQASSRNAELIVKACATHGDLAPVEEYLVRSRLDGIIVAPPLGDWPPLLAVLEASNVPVVAIATGRAPRWALSVCVDDFGAAYELTCHLVGLGHERIGFIEGNPIQSASTERLAGFRAALRDHNISIDQSLVAPGLFTYRSGLAAADTLLSLKGPPTAIFAANDDMAAAVVAIAHRHGLIVPDQLTVCGFDDAALATSIFPELTTIRQPIMDMAQTALDLLVDRVKSNRAGRSAVAPVHMTMPYNFIQRESDGPPATIQL